VHCGPDCRICSAIRRAVVEAGAVVGVDGLDAAILSEIAGVPAEAIARHGPGSIGGWTIAAYDEATHHLQADFDADFDAGDTWSEGLRLATDHLVTKLAGDTAQARFCYVEVPRGGHELRAQRECVRQRSIDLFTRQYTRRHGSCDVPEVKLELACNAIIHVIASHARDGHATDLPDALEAMLRAARACEPQAFG
jgi:hypothetical protein